MLALERRALLVALGRALVRLGLPLVERGVLLRARRLTPRLLGAPARSGSTLFGGLGLPLGVLRRAS